MIRRISVWIAYSISIISTVNKLEIIKNKNNIESRIWHRMTRGKRRGRGRVSYVRHLHVKVWWRGGGKRRKPQTDHIIRLLHYHNCRHMEFWCHLAPPLSPLLYCYCRQILPPPIPSNLARAGEEKWNDWWGGLHIRSLSHWPSQNLRLMGTSQR